MVVVVVADRCRWSARHAVSRLDALAVCRRCTRRLSSRPHHTHRPTDGRSLVGSFSLVQEHSLCQRPLADTKPASCPLLVVAANRRRIVSSGRSARLAVHRNNCQSRHRPAASSTWQRTAAPARQRCTHRKRAVAQHHAKRHRRPRPTSRAPASFSHAARRRRRRHMSVRPDAQQHASCSSLTQHARIPPVAQINSTVDF